MIRIDYFLVVLTVHTQIECLVYLVD